MSILVLIWSRNNHDQINFHNDARLSSLKELCEYVETQYKIYRAVPGVVFDRNYHSIILLPEYYFTRIRTHELEAKAMQESVKDDVVRKLQELSRNHPGILLIPGTIAFRKSFVRPPGKEYKLENGAYVAKSKTREQKFTERVVQPSPVNQGFNQDYHGKFNARNVGLAEQSVKLLFDKTFKGQDYVNQYYHLYKNQAYVLLGGHIIYKYAKQANYFELQGANTEVQMFAPNKKGNTTIIDGEKFCFEICFDHANSIAVGATQMDLLRELMYAINTGAPPPPTAGQPQYHIVLSDWATNNTSVAKPGGYFVHASTNSMVSGVYRMLNGGSSVKLNPVVQWPCYGSEANLYLV